MRPAVYAATALAIIVTMFLMGPCSRLQGDSIAVDKPEDRSAAASVNAFALGYFAGLTIGGSDIVIGGLMNEGEADLARADRRTHSDVDDFGKILGFVTLVFFGWRLFKRLNTDT